MNNIDKRKPNDLLRHERESRSWTQERVADELYQRCKDDARVSKRGIINTNMISRWESGKHRPNLYWQEQLSLLYGKSLEELGFVEPLPSLERPPTYVSTGSQSGTVTLPTPNQAIDLLLEASETTPEELVGTWLALQAGDLAVLFQKGWTIEDILISLRVVLKGTQAMPNISRRDLGRKFLQFGTVAVLSGISIPSGRHISAEERIELHRTLGESIIAGWQLFHTAGNAQVLAVSQALLYLVQHAQVHLYPSVQSIYYSGVYRLMGAALFFQGRYEEAQHAQLSAYAAALEGADGWNMAQSRTWQVYGYQALGQHDQAIQAIVSALRLTAGQDDEASRRLYSHLLACWAESALTLREFRVSQEKLEASASFLNEIHPNEEFDRSHWLQIAGNCALARADYSTAIDHLEDALASLSPNWLMRQAVTAVPLATAYARSGERTKSVEVAKKAVTVLSALNAPIMTNQLIEYLRHDLLGLYPSDTSVRTFLHEVSRQIPQTAAALA